MLLSLVALVAAATACGDDDDAESSDTEPSIATEAPIPLVPPEPDLSDTPSADPDFIPAILDDDIVDDDELVSAYEAFVGCLADGGGYGRYAFDLALELPLTLDWRTAADVDAAELEAACSRDFLGDLILQHATADSIPDDRDAARRASVVECVGAIDPAAAEDVPELLSTEQDDDADGYFIGDADLDDDVYSDNDPAAIAIRDCYLSLGTGWTEFGDAPEGPDDSQG